MTDLIEAKFVGLDGSLGYKYGQTYKLVIETSDNSPQVLVRLPDGSGRCPYDSTIVFLKNWQVVNAEAAPAPVMTPEMAGSVEPAMPGDDRAFEASTYIDSKGKEHVINELTEPHLLNIARKNWRTGRPHAGIDAELKRRNINLKEHLTKEDLE